MTSGLPGRWERIDRWLHEGFGDEDSPTFRAVNGVIVVLILVSIVSVTLASVPELYARYQVIFDVSEIVVVAAFLLEYLINIYVARDRKAYVFGLWGAIDLLAILPSLLLLFDLRGLKVARVLRVMRFLRLMRILRVLKLARLAARQYERSREKRLNTLKLDLQIYFIALLSAVVIFSTLEFYAEELVPHTQFTSIPASMWWCIVTITTTGYGDMYPSTVAGRLVAAATMLTGLALFGLLMNVVGKAMLSSLFGAADLEAHEETLRRAEEIVTRRPRHSRPPEAEPQQVPPASLSAEPTCPCGAALQPAWRLCPLCGRVVGQPTPP
jgi:voltage-gated potassium channel